MLTAPTTPSRVAPDPDGTPRRGRPRRSRLLVAPDPVAAGLGALGVVGAVALWALVVATGFVSSTVLPPPHEVAVAIVDLLGSGAWWQALADTAGIWALALVAMVAVAVPLGLVVGSLPAAYPPLAGLVHVLRSIPSTALIPVAIVVLGLGGPMKFAIVAYAISWPLLLNTIYGVQAIDPMVRVAARSLRWGRWRVFTRLTVPAAAGYIGTGIRLSGGIGLVVVLSAELLGARYGVGRLIVSYQQAEQPDFVYAGIVLVGVLGTLAFYALSLLERVLSPWAPEHRRG